MTRLPFSLSIVAAAFSLVLAASPAEALNTSSYVSFYTGNNVNTCTTPAAACKTITGALLKTEPGGEIKCLDNHQEGQLFIEKPIIIDCGAPGTSISVNGTPGAALCGRTKAGG
jgi:hypothetical protein